VSAPLVTRSLDPRGLDPRTRLALALLYAAGVMLARELACLAVAWGLLLAGVLVCGQGRAYLRWLPLVGWMIASWFVISLLSAGLATAIWAAVRLLALATTFYLFFRTTPPEELGNALVRSGLPYEVAFVMSVGMQFVPVLARKARSIVDAQRSRGIPLEPGPRALRHYPALMGPVLVQAFQLADELAEAMEARGFGRPGRTFAREYRMRAADWLAIAGGVVALVGLIVLRQ
jgi:energy-coupling factor transport system permease protein